MIGSVAAGIAADRDEIARADRAALNSLPAELTSRTPLRRPRHVLALRAVGLQQNRRVRVPEKKLDHSALDRDGFVGVGRSEGVMRPGTARTEKGRARQQNAQAELGPPRHPMIIHNGMGGEPIF